ncbi:hypothetical protein NECAME_00099 [Necator americanus]|uniref:E1 domain-containing protein n=1 Tax=Necator americanus TaxID=51031 RepID=W2TYT9_NECAM|nr:hypothetical protein NECAME_00099 [Necator americanus]ETN87240.1 hypothetical protein NECAME_00099 [Necator americanus]
MFGNFAVSVVAGIECRYKWADKKAAMTGVSASVDGSSTKKHEKFVPLVAFECGYRNKYMSEDGIWISDENRYATCLSGKLDILKYCKKSGCVEDANIAELEVK